jgi:hypothetical protein
MNGTSLSKTVDLSLSIANTAWQIQGAGDFDQDNRDDIVWRNYSTGENAIWSMQLNATSGKYEIKSGLLGGIYFTPVPDLTWKIEGVGDFNGDGKADLIWRNIAVTGLDAGKNAVWMMNSVQTTFTNGVVTKAELPFLSGNIISLSTADQNWQMRGSGDFNGDGKSELLWQNKVTGENAAWYLGGINSTTQELAFTSGTFLTRIGPNSAWQSYGPYNFYETNPTVTAALANNPGGTGVTSDPTVAGQVSGARASKALLARLGTVQPFTSILTTLPTNGQFTLSRAQLEQLNGGKPLADGAYTLQLQAQDIHLNLSGMTSLAFTLQGAAKLAAGSDNGLSSSDGITSVSRPTYAGATSAGNTVSLFGNNTLIGETKAAADGTWSIATLALDDGVYTISQRVTNATGGVTTQTLGQQLMIDTTSPDTEITGPIDGVAWGDQINLAGILRDLDPLTKVTYSVLTGGSSVVSGELTTTVDNIANAVWTQRTLAPKLISLGAPTSTDIFKPYEVLLNFTDRAGNISIQSYKGMRLNLPDLTEESILLPDSVMPTTSDARTPSSTNDPASQSHPTDAGGWLYIGNNGSWGYGTTGGGGWGWSPSPNASPAIPSSVPDPNTLIGYLPALRIALTTARDVLSNVPATAAKKDSLNRHLELLMKTGEVVDTKGFYEMMRPMLKGVFATALGVGGSQITKRQAILNGWELAKALALETKLTTLQIFQANLYATSLAALKNNGTTVSITALKQTVEALATTYVRLQPLAGGVINYRYIVYGQNPDFLGSLLHDGRVRSNGGQIDAGLVVQQAIADLQGHLLGQADPLKALQLVDRMLQVAAQDSQLYNDAYRDEGTAYFGSYSYQVSSSIHDTGFLDGLSELAFEIARSNPMVTTGANPTSEWIETLWEAGDLSSASGGLAAVLAGFQLPGAGNGPPPVYFNYDGPLYTSRQQMKASLNYMVRLLQTARLVDPSLATEFNRADTLSYLVNLGGAYAALNPDSSTSGSAGVDLGDFLATAWQGSNLQKSAVELKQFLGNFNGARIRTKALQFETKMFQAVRQAPLFKARLGNMALDAALGVLGGHYVGTFDPVGDNLTLSGFFANIWRAKTPQDIISVSYALQKFASSRTSLTDQDVIDILLDDNMPILKLIGPGNSRAGARLWDPNRYVAPSPQAIEAAKWQSKATFPALPAGFQFSTNIVNSKKALVVDPYGDRSSAGGYLRNIPGSRAEADSIEATLTASAFQVTRLHDFQIQDLLKLDLGGYGAIAFTSHGSIYSNGSFDRNVPTGADTTSIKSILWANDRVGITSILQNRQQLLNLTLVMSPSSFGSTFGITPDFIKKYSTQRNSNSIVYLGTCVSTKNDSLVKAFQDIGAGAVFGYDRYVNDDWAKQHGVALFNALSTGRTVGSLSFVGDKNPDDGTLFTRTAKPASLNLALIGG